MKTGLVQTLDSGLDRGQDFGLDFGLDFVHMRPFVAKAKQALAEHHWLVALPREERTLAVSAQRHSSPGPSSGASLDGSTAARGAEYLS